MSANDYFTGPASLRTPPDNTAFTNFAGASLSLDPGGKMNCKHNGNFTNNNLLLNGGTLWLGGGSVTTNLVHYGTITLNTTTNSFIATDVSSRSIDFRSVIRGTGNAVLVISNILGGVTLSGANVFTNVLLITNSAVVRANNTNALGATNGFTVIAPGGVLDVTRQNLGAEYILAGGSGTNNAGAILSAAGSQNNALRYVTLTADTTFGGLSSTRRDIRNPDAGRSCGRTAST